VSPTARQLQVLIGAAAILAPGIHTLTDVAEWVTKGFSVPQLWANYLAFVIMPFLFVGLFAVQRETIGILGLVGALLYGAAFIYFAHTTLYALVEQVPDYESLWSRLGSVYTAHGILMILGGLLFGAATFRAGRFPRWTAIVFLCGIAINLALGIIATPEIFQVFGSALRNAGLIGMGVVLLMRPTPHPA